MALIDSQLLDAWYAGRVTPPWKFELNAPVQVSIDESVVDGTVVSPVDTEQDPLFLVELSDGSRVEVRQSLLSRGSE